MSSRLRTETELEQLRKRSTDPEFAPAWTALLDRADRALREGLRPVAEGAGWGHGYYCPDHVEVLDFDPARPERHRCPVDGKDHAGPEFDSGWRCILNGRILDGIGASGVVWQATGEVRYREHVSSILEEYARIYPGLPQNGRHVGKGRVTGQSLEEAVWGIGIAHAYDDIRESLHPGQQRAIETDLLAAIGAQVHSQLLNKIHNIECWHLSSLATLGTALADPELLAIATEGEFALPAQLSEGILPDGWWAEGSPNYHFYMASGVMHAVHALRQTRPDAIDTERFHAMFSAPLRLVRPDLSLPALNDGWLDIAQPLGVASAAGLYEQAWGLWPDPGTAQLLRDLYDGGIPRTSEAALTSGPDLREETGPAPRRLQPVHPSSGYAVLADADRFLLLKYGPHGGGHGHPDKLQLDLHAFGTRLAPDAGSPAYNSPLQSPWFRQTLSHNSIVLGGRSQPEGEGQLLYFLDPAENPVGLADARVGWPADYEPARPGSWLREPRHRFVPEYAGSLLRRVVLFKPGGYFLDLVLVRTPEPVSIDLAWHHRGQILGDYDRAQWSVPGGDAYEFLDDVRTVPTGQWRLDWRIGDAGTSMWGLDPVGAEAVLATSPSNPPAERQSTLVRRASGRSAVFAAVIEPHPGRGSVQEVEWLRNDLDGGGTLELTVHSAATRDHWEIGWGENEGVGVETSPVTGYRCVLRRAGGRDGG